MMARPAETRGFTLLELLIVIGIIAMLGGIGVGFLRRSETSRSAALSAVAGQLRAAALSARVRGLPAEVRVLPADDVAPARVQARELDAVAVWHFEPGVPMLLDVLEPTLTGEVVEQGRFGRARRNADGQRTAVLRLAAPPAHFDLHDGFAFRIDLKLERRAAGTILRLGRCFEWTLDGDGRPAVRAVRRDVTGQSGATAMLTADTALPLRQWVTLEVAFDGGELWCNLDGRRIGTVPATGVLHQDDGDQLELSPGDSPVPGAMDELQWFAYVWAPPLSLPNGVEVKRPWRVRFDGDGDADTREPLEWVLHDEGRSEALTVRRGGVIE